MAMQWRDINTLKCSIARTLSVIGDRWTLLILRELFFGSRRFEEFQVHLQVSPHVLSMRLGKLVEHGIVRRRPYQERPRRHAYELTEKGRDLSPVLAALIGWGDRWMSDGDEPPVRAVHGCSDHATGLTLTCVECGATPDEAEIDFVLSPSRAKVRADRLASAGDVSTPSEKGRKDAPLP